jgi:hypothetical protein
MRTSKSVILTAAAMVAGGVLAASVSASAGGVVTAARSGAAGAPARFNHPVANPYFPLEPGTVSRYHGTDEGERLREKVVVTHKTKTVDGVRTTVVLDVLRRADGTLAEKTHDWYAADNDGNVWYFGERTATYDENGDIESREGSWEAGVDGAVAGKIMPADPRPSTAYRQELYPRHAEDQAWIVQRNARASVPFGRLDHVVRSFEWSRLEPHVLSVKLYAPGLGIVREKDLTGGSEVFELVSVRHRS